MAAALYDPEGGYYARGAGQVGKDGDFFTSVSTGPVFGRLLAERIAGWVRGLGESGLPPRWRVIELGAHDARLAGDILRGLAELGIAHGCEYEILEPLSALAAAQRERIAAEGLRATVRSSVEELAQEEPLPTYLLANEVLDALPFQLVVSTGDGWRERGVGLSDAGEFGWADLGPVQTDLPQRPAGYVTEVRSDFAAFFAPLVKLLNPGRMLWIDYGFPRSVYYDEARTAGTLRTFHRHQAGDDPLDLPGERDITAHVDFTAAAAALQSLGGAITLFEDQGRTLTTLARDWLLAREGAMTPAMRKELLAFQTLIHPGHLGSRFHFLEASFHEDVAASPRALERLEAKSR